MRSYKLIRGSAAEAFMNSRAKIRLYGGGFGNGKTTALVADTLRVALDYPGATMLLARASYPKLNSTLRREFVKWCPQAWIKSFNKQDNTCVLHNETIIDFRYIDQRGSVEGEQTSNLLSANYDYIGVDQIDDPEITESDFEQLLGRLRGSTEYKGGDPTMPETGPRMMALTCNPTLGWPYKRIVKPYHNFMRGQVDYDLICVMDENGMPKLDENGKQQPLVSVHEASTYENAQNLPPDFITTLEATYRGKMRKRYLLGEWLAFEGVVYDEFDEDVHVVPKQYMLQHIASLRAEGWDFLPTEGYDFGITEPSAYLLAIADASGAVYVLDGFYEREMGVEEQARIIKELRRKYIAPTVRVEEMTITADPQVYKRTNASNRGAGTSVLSMFNDHGVWMRAANNDVLPGILRVKDYMHVSPFSLNPFTTGYGAPKLYVADTCTFLRDELTTYRWQKSKHGDTPMDQPVGKDNHACDALRYMLSGRINAPRRVTRRATPISLNVRKWHEPDNAMSTADARRHRYS